MWQKQRAHDAIYREVKSGGDLRKVFDRVIKEFGLDNKAASDVHCSFYTDVYSVECPYCESGAYSSPYDTKERFVNDLYKEGWRVIRGPFTLGIIIERFFDRLKARNSMFGKRSLCCPKCSRVMKLFSIARREAPRFIMEDPDVVHMMIHKGLGYDLIDEGFTRCEKCGESCANGDLCFVEPGTVNCLQFPGPEEAPAAGRELLCGECFYTRCEMMLRNSGGE